MTPDVARLREMRKQFGDRTYMQTGVFERPTMRDMADVLDALIDILAPSPPDGAAEREAPDDLDAHPFIEPVSRLHAEAMRRLGREKEAGDALRIKHAEGWIDALGHAIGMLKLTAMDKPTPAPTEAPAAGDGEAAIATRMALCREFVAQQSASSEWKDGAATGFYAGWNAALAARPAAAVTEAGPYLIWSNAYRRWWRADRSGYTSDIDSAGRYSRLEALQCARVRDWLAHDDGGPGEIAISEADALASWRKP